MLFSKHSQTGLEKGKGKQMDNQTAHRQILELYREQENIAEGAYRFAKGRHTASTVLQRKKHWENSRDILFAVDTALTLFRERTETESAN